MINKEKIKDIIGVSILGGILVLIIFGILFFFGGTIISILGLKYNNIWSLIKFFIIYMIIATPVDFIIECFFKVIKDLTGLSEMQHLIIYSFVDILINTLIIGILEWAMDGIECSLITALLFSTISSIINCILIKKQDDEEKQVNN